MCCKKLSNIITVTNACLYEIIRLQSKINSEIFFEPQYTTESSKAILNRKYLGKSLKINNVQWFFFPHRSVRKSSEFRVSICKRISNTKVCTKAIYQENLFIHVHTYVVFIHTWILIYLYKLSITFKIIYYMFLVKTSTITFFLNDFRRKPLVKVR